MKTVKICITLEFDYDTGYDDDDIEHMINTNLEVAEGVFDLGAGTSPSKVDYSIEVT